MGLMLSDLTDEQKEELEIKNGVLIEDITGSARGNIRPATSSSAVINRVPPIDAKSAEQVNALIAKLEKGAAVTFLLRRGEQQFYSSVQGRQRRRVSGAQLSAADAAVRALLPPLRRDARRGRALASGREVSRSTRSMSIADPALEARWGDRRAGAARRRARAVPLPRSTARRSPYRDGAALIADGVSRVVTESRYSAKIQYLSLQCRGGGRWVGRRLPGGKQRH